MDDKRKDLTKDFGIQIARVQKIFETTIRKLQLLSFTPVLFENGSYILKLFLSASDVHFLNTICYEDNSRSLSNFSRLSSISSTLVNLKMFKKNPQPTNKNFPKSPNIPTSADEPYETHIAYVVDTILRSKGLTNTLQKLLNERPISVGASAFIDLMIEFKDIILERLQVTAIEEINHENDLKTAYRSTNLLSKNVEQIEAQLEQQRDELGKEFETKYEIMTQLRESIEELKEKSKEEIKSLILDSETKMMKEYNKSTANQEILAVDAKTAVTNYETLLQNHLHDEKTLRAKRLKVESQLASWLAKYDQDVGEKQIEFEAIENEYNEEKAKYDKLREDFEDQQLVYNVLMREKEEEERRIYEEKAYIFLKNRSARLIQRCWRAYRIRKLARKRGKKGKKGEKKSAKAKKVEPVTTMRGGPDPNALIDSKFGGDIMTDLKTGDDPFAQKEVTVDLS